MNRLLLTSDLHLGHRSAYKWRPRFSSPEEHDDVIYDNLASSVGKRDTVYFLGDVAFTDRALLKIQNLKVKHKVLILGNHDLERGMKLEKLLLVYDKIMALYSKRNLWFSHCPIHPSEMRRRLGCVHGHTHATVVDDPRYFNVCLEQTEYKPILFSAVMDEMLSRNLE